MSTLKLNAVQLGQSLTASQNFTLYQPAIPDGTFFIANGNSASPTNLIKVGSTGNLTFANSISLSAASTKTLTLNGGAGSNGLVIDASNNVGIGTAPLSGKFSVLASTNTYGLYITDGTYSGGLIPSSSTGGLILYNGVAQPLGFWTNNTEKMRLDASGNLGLGVTPSAWRTDYSFKALQMPGGTFAAYVAGGLDPTPNISANAYVDSGGTWRYLNSRAASWYLQNGGMHAWYTAPSGTAGNAISFTQAMGLDASGNLLVGDTSSPTAAKVMSKNTVGQFCYVSNAANQSGGYYHITFLQAGTQVGSITSTGTTTTYSTTSDQRLKTDLGPATETSVIDNTVIHDFEWKSDGIKCRGVFAQEAVVVNPNAVNQGISDELNEDGLPVHPWGVDYSKYVPDLIVYCQQLNARLEALEAK